MTDPRYPTLPNRFRAEKEVIEVIEASSLEIIADEELDLSPHVSLSPPRPKPKKVFTPDSKLSPCDRILLIMSGGKINKKKKLLDGSSEDVADKIMEFLNDEKIL
jgi:hypothetical protein